MSRFSISRRKFLERASLSTVSALALGALPTGARPATSASTPAILGGQSVRARAFPSWPIWDRADERAILPVLRSGVWSRRDVVKQAEEKFAALMGAKYCLLTTNGTHALIASLYALGIGGGDEVITTPYTFVASVDAILLNNALPVFVDIDPDTWQIDPDKIEAKITENTTAIMPVHITSSVSHMDKINAIARKHKLKVIEDACEVHLAEWRHKKVGTLGDLGCFSLQNGKCLTCGEGGAVVGDDERIMDLCYSYHNFGRPQGRTMPRGQYGHPILGTKCRMAEYQASILMTQMDSVEAETTRRSENAEYLDVKLKDIPGIKPMQAYEETTRRAYYYYGFRYQKQHFDGLGRDVFVKALRAEGIPVNTGLGVIEGVPMHKEGLIEATLNSKTFQRLYAKDRLESYRAQLECPECDRLVAETVGFHSRALLGTKQDMDDIYQAILKIYENRQRLS